MPVKRGVLFELQTSLASDAGAAIDALDKKIEELQRRANITITATMAATQQAGATAGRGLVGGTPATPSATPSTSGAGATASNNADAVERARLRRRSDMRREAEERDRLQAERTAKIVEKANREALDQQTKDLRKAEVERQKILKRRETEEARDLNRVQRERQRDLHRSVKSDEAHWSDFEKFGQRSKATREKQEARDAKAAARTAKDDARRAEQERARRERDQSQWDLILGGNGRTGTAGMHGPSRADVTDPFGLGAYQRQRQSADRAAEQSAARQREAQARVRESLNATTEAVARLGEGFAYLGLVGERDMQSLRDSLLTIRGVSDVISGGVRAASNIGNVVRTIHQARGGAGATRAAASGFGQLLPRLAGAGVGTGIMGTGVTAGGLAGAGAAALPIAALAAGAFYATPGGHHATGNLGARLGMAQHRAGRAISRTFQRLGMDQAKQLQFDYDEAHNQEDPFANRRGTGADESNDDAFAKAAASERNLERQQRHANKLAHDRAIRRELENAELPSQYREIGLHREQTERKSAIERRHAAVEFQHTFEKDSGLDLLKKDRQRVGERIGGLQAGLAAQMRTNPLAARQSRVQLEYLEAQDEQARTKIEVTTAKRDREMKLQTREQAVQSRREQNAAALQSHQNIAAGLGGDNAEARINAQEKIKQLEQEQRDIIKEEYEISEQRRKGEIQDAAKLVQLAQQRMQIATRRVQDTTEKTLTLKEGLGHKTPMELNAMYAAYQRAKRGEKLSREEMSLLEGGGAEMQSFAKQDARKRMEEFIGSLPQADQAEARQAFFGQEEKEERDAIAEENAARQNLSGASQAGALAGEVTVGGAYNITIDIRDDMQLADKLRDEFSTMRDEMRRTEERIMDAARKAAQEVARQIQSQGRNNAR